MKPHYFQRYHQKENVSTANTLLLLSRVYSIAPEKFFRFLKSEIFSDSFEPEIIFNLQEKSEKSVPDATITQSGFKIVVETKLYDSFDKQQLINHLECFKDEKYKVLISLAPVPMSDSKKNIIDNEIENYNNKTKSTTNIKHKNMTFESLTDAIRDVLDERDYEMQEILDDYIDYCNNDNLIPQDSSKYIMRMQLASATFDFNIRENIYYENAKRSFRPHDYLALYKNKSIRAIGKICARIIAVETENGMVYRPEYGEITEERKNKILKAIEDGRKYGYDLKQVEHRYFFVEQFFNTDFRKITPYAPMGTRIFNLTDILDTDQMPETSEIAKILLEKTWG